MRPTHIEHIGIRSDKPGGFDPFFERVLDWSVMPLRSNGPEGKNRLFPGGETKIELLESTESGGAISRFLEKRGPGSTTLPSQWKM